MTRGTSIAVSTARLRVTALMILTMFPARTAAGQIPEVNYDEASVPVYTLPDPLVFADGTPVTDADAWQIRRRREILALFARHVYGKTPVGPVALRSAIRSVDEMALDGKATRVQFSEARMLSGGTPGGTLPRDTSDVVSLLEALTASTPDSTICIPARSSTAHRVRRQRFIIFPPCGVAAPMGPPIAFVLWRRSPWILRRGRTREQMSGRLLTVRRPSDGRTRHPTHASPSRTSVLEGSQGSRPTTPGACGSCRCL